MKPDFQYIRIPLALIILTLIFSTIVYSSSNWYEESILSQFYAVERGFNTAKRQYEESNRNRSLYEQYLTNYLKLSEEGIIGEERRLNWIELLQNLDRELNLPALNYEIEAKKPAMLSGINLQGNVQVYQSEMGLKLEVLHEDDFFHLFESVNQGAEGFYSLRECELLSKIGNNGPTFAQSSGNLAAECQLSWITVIVNG